MPKSQPSASYLNRRRWTVADARAAMAALAESGLSASAFARREGLELERVYRWRRRLNAQGSSGAPAFVEVHRTATAPMEVVLRSGRVLRFTESIDTAALKRIVEALDEEPAC